MIKVPTEVEVSPEDGSQIRLDPYTRVFTDESGNLFKADELAASRTSRALLDWLDTNYPQRRRHPAITVEGGLVKNDTLDRARTIAIAALNEAHCLHDPSLKKIMDCNFCTSLKSEMTIARHIEPIVSDKISALAEIETLTTEVRDKDARITELENALRDYLEATTDRKNVTVTFPVSGSPKPLHDGICASHKGHSCNCPSVAFISVKQDHSWVNNGICCRLHATAEQKRSTMIVCPECGDKRCARASMCDASCENAADGRESS